MPRRNRPKREDPAPVRRNYSAVPVAAPPGWQALRHLGGEPGRDYTCPVCRRTFPASIEHIVAWRSETDGERRRHWHNACWQRAQREGIERYRWE
jgi:hypothetical protein